jgi:hypothetical protein
MKITIKSWIDGRTLAEGDHPDVRSAVAAAVQAGAVLSGADLSGADLSGADLSGADLSGADLSGAVGLPEAPTVPGIDAAILERVESGGGHLDMGAWHTCDTTHCRAGWAIVLAGEAGRALEARLGPAVAGTLIYLASRPGVPPPDFYRTTDAALADLRACAAAADPVPPAGTADPGRKKARGDAPRAARSRITDPPSAKGPAMDKLTRRGQAAEPAIPDDPTRPGDPTWDEIPDDPRDPLAWAADLTVWAASGPHAEGDPFDVPQSLVTARRLAAEGSL